MRPAVAAVGLVLPQLVHQLANLLLGRSQRLVADSQRLVADNVDRQFVHLAQIVEHRTIIHLAQC